MAKAKGLFYRQCVLERTAATGKVRTTTWLPERGNGISIVEGVTLIIKPHGDKEFAPERWTVASVGTTRQPEDRVHERAHNWKKYREATDI